MRFKATMCQVMCLVTVVILHSATAQYAWETVEQSPTKYYGKSENLSDETGLQLQKNLKAQYKELDNTLVDEDTSTTTINLRAEMRAMRKQLAQVMSDFQYQKSQTKQESACDSVFKQLQNITNAHETLIDAIRSVRTTTDSLQEEMQEMRKQLAPVTSDLQYQKSLGKQASIRASENQQLQNRTNAQYNAQETIEGLADNPPPCRMTNVDRSAGTYQIISYKMLGKSYPVACSIRDSFNLGGGWTVFQQRKQGNVNFYHNWEMYRNGFGDVRGDHWLGLEKVHAMTKSGVNELLVYMKMFDGKSAYAHYGTFKVGSEAERYQLTVGEYSGTAGDSLAKHNRMRFATFDKESYYTYAKKYHGAWWFYSNSYTSHLNGKYHKENDRIGSEYGLHWQAFSGYWYSLKETVMMLRRRPE